VPPLPTFVAAGTKSEAGPGTNLTPALPSYQTGDVLLMGVETAQQVVALADAAGFTEVDGSPIFTGAAGGTGATRLAVYWKRAAGVAEAAPTIWDPGDHTVAVIASFRGCIHTGQPWSTTTGDVASASTTSVAVPGATAAVANSLVVVWATSRVDNSTGQIGTWINGDLDNVTQRVNYGSNLGNGGTVAMATGEKAAAGAFGTTFALASNTGEQAHFAMVLVPPNEDPITSRGTWEYQQIDWVDAEWVDRLDVG
jgi:hypothetical protein